MTQASDRRKLLGGAIGNIGEQFDYSIYALVAPTLATHFFPSTNPVAALLSTFAVYALSFLARPFGGVLFGYIGDRYGRLAVLTWTVVLMGGGTMLVGLLPTYQAIGVAAPVLLVVCRLLQGLSLGGETTGVESYIAESAPDGKRATWMTKVMSFVYWPAAAVAVFVLGVRTSMSTAAFDSWGWRIPFLLGGVVAVVGYVLRRTLDDPEEYKEAAAEHRRAMGSDASKSVVRVLDASFGTRKSMLLVILLQPPMAIAAYLLTGYMYTYVVREGGLSPTQGLLSNSAAIAVLAALMPVMGRLCDRFGRKRMYLVGAVWLFVMAYPAFRLAGAGNFAAAFGGQVLLSVGIAVYCSALFVGMVELFPTAVRCRSHGISYNISVALFGGTTPLVATALIGGTGNPVAPAFYAMAMIAVIGMVGVLLVPETKDVGLRWSVFGKPDTTSPSAAADTRAGTV